MSRVVVLLNHSFVGLRSAWRAHAAAISLTSRIIKFLPLPVVLSLLLSACALEGDFGRPRPTVFTKLTDEFLLNVDILSRGQVRTEFSRDELIMREAGERMTRPLELGPDPARVSYDSKPGGYGPVPWIQPNENPLTFMAAQLNSAHRDLTLFGQAARRVLVSDSRRIDGVLKLGPGLRAQEKRAARIQMQENFDYIDSVFESFASRMKAFYYAIEDIQSTAPGVVVIEAQGSLRQLRGRTASLNYELSSFFKAALARSDSQPIRSSSQDFSGFNPSMPYGPSPDRRLPYGEGPGKPPAYSFK